MIVYFRETLSLSSMRVLGLAAFFLLPILLAQLCDAAGPAINRNFPDPCIAQSQSGEWFAFSTESEGINIQLASSPDFETWTFHDGYDALPTLPSWAEKQPKARVWAPDVNALPNGSGYIMYFAAVGKTHSKRHCIATATSKNIEGPYTPSNTPLICDLEQGGNIDPNLFHDPVNGKYFLVYKIDGNAIGHGGACGNTRTKVAATPLYQQELSPDDLTRKIGAPHYLVSNLNPAGSFKFDGPNTERPSIAFRNNTYYLLYNAQCYADLAYRVDYVSCIVGQDTHDGMAGCDWTGLKAAQQKVNERTLLKTGDTFSGAQLHAPGSVDTSEDSNKMVFHGDVNLEWFKRKKGQDIQRNRAMYAAEIDFDHKSGDLVIVKLY